jgi:hypothetical protein
MKVCRWVTADLLFPHRSLRLLGKRWSNNDVLFRDFPGKENAHILKIE